MTTRAEQRREIELARDDVDRHRHGHANAKFRQQAAADTARSWEAVAQAIEALPPESSSQTIAVATYRALADSCKLNERIAGEHLAVCADATLTAIEMHNALVEAFES